MAGINKVILIGNLGQKPEVKYGASGTAITNLSIATSESWNDKNTGEKQEKTEWHRAVLFGKLAEIAGQYLDKGSKVYVEGRLQTSKYQAKDGSDRYSTDIVVGILQMLDKRGGDAPQQQAPAAAAAAPAAAAAAAPAQDPITPVDDNAFDDDIPF